MSKGYISIRGLPTGYIDATLEYFIEDEDFEKIKVTATQHPKCEHLWLGYGGRKVNVVSQISFEDYRGFVDIITTFPGEPKFLRIIPFPRDSEEYKIKISRSGGEDHEQVLVDLTSASDLC